MQGRVENDMKLKKRVENALKNEPVLLRQYIDSLSDSTWVTKKNYLNIVSLFFRWLIDNGKVKKIDIENMNQLLPLDISAYMNDLQYTTDKNGVIRESSSSRRTIGWSVLNSFFEFMVMNGMVKENIVSKTKRPKNKDKSSSEYLNQAQIKKLMKKLENPKAVSHGRQRTLTCDALIIKIFLTTGMRAEPLREINIEDIDFEKETVITINKGHKTKEFKLVKPVMEVMERWLDQRAELLKQPRDQQTGPLFVSNHGTRVSYSYIYDTVKYYTSLLGIENGLSCHKLRHSYGTAVYMATKDIEYTKNALGHQDISTTQRYINEVDDSMDELVNSRLTAMVG